MLLLLLRHHCGACSLLLLYCQYTGWRLSALALLLLLLLLLCWCCQSTLALLLLLLLLLLLCRCHLSYLALLLLYWCCPSALALLLLLLCWCRCSALTLLLLLLLLLRWHLCSTLIPCCCCCCKSIACSPSLASSIALQRSSAPVRYATLTAHDNMQSCTHSSQCRCYSLYSLPYAVQGLAAAAMSGTPAAVLAPLLPVCFCPGMQCACH
jgi:hypothetical protein